MRSGWQSRREGPATQRNEALFESFLQRRDLWPPGGTQPILISDFTTPSVPFRIQRAPCCVVLHLLSLRWSLRSSAHPRSPRHKKQPILISVGGILPSLCISPKLRSLLSEVLCLFRIQRASCCIALHLLFLPSSLTARVQGVGRKRNAQTLPETRLNHLQ